MSSCVVATGGPNLTTWILLDTVCQTWLLRIPKTCPGDCFMARWRYLCYFLVPGQLYWKLIIDSCYMLRTQCAWPFLSRERELRCEIRTGREREREREREELRMLVGEERSTLMDMQFTPLPLRASESEDVELGECWETLGTCFKSLAWITR